MSQYADPTAQRSVDEFVTVKVVGEVKTTVHVYNLRLASRMSEVTVTPVKLVGHPVSGVYVTVAPKVEALFQFITCDAIV